MSLNDKADTIRAKCDEWIAAAEAYRPDWPDDAPWDSHEQEKDDAIADVYHEAARFLLDLLGEDEPMPTPGVSS